MLTSFFCWALYTLTRLWCLGWWWVALLGVGCPTERLLSPRGHDLCMTLRNFAHETPVICCNPNALQSAKIQVSLNCINIHFHGMLIWCWMAKHVKKTNRYFLIYCVPARYTSSRCVAFLWNLKTTSSHQSSTNSCRRSFGSKGPKARGGNKTQYFESLGVGSISRVFIERSHVFVQQEGSQVLLFSPFTFQNGNDDWSKLTQPYTRLERVELRCWSGTINGQWWCREWIGQSKCSKKERLSAEKIVLSCTLQHLPASYIFNAELLLSLCLCLHFHVSATTFSTSWRKHVSRVEEDTKLRFINSWQYSFSISLA